MSTLPHLVCAAALLPLVGLVPKPVEPLPCHSASASADPARARMRTPSPDEDARRVVARMQQAIGGSGALRARRDVELTYTYRNLTKDVADVSLERYVFDGETSWARYDRREVFAMPGSEQPVFSWFDGERTESRQNGQLVEGRSADVLHFLRRTNFYWFCMFFKLDDPGVRVASLPSRTVDDIEYDVVEVSFGDAVGESPRDRYVLYVNPYTHLVDLFLFNVTGFGVETPFRMDVKYTMVDGVLLPVWRRYRPALGWEGHEVDPEGDVVLELTEDVTFDNGFGPEAFALR
jgi:hypothetical protein